MLDYAVLPRLFHPHRHSFFASMNLRLHIFSMWVPGKTIYGTNVQGCGWPRPPLSLCWPLQYLLIPLSFLYHSEIKETPRKPLCSLFLLQLSSVAPLENPRRSFHHAKMYACWKCLTEGVGGGGSCGWVVGGDVGLLSVKTTASWQNARLQ